MNTKTKTFMVGVAVGFVLHYAYNQTRGSA